MRKAISIILIIVIQLLIDNYLNLGLYLYVAIFPFLILTLPYRYKTIPTMLLSFLLGLSIDFLSNGVLGLNAGALTAMAFVRQGLLQNLSMSKVWENMIHRQLKDWDLVGSSFIFYFHI